MDNETNNPEPETPSPLYEADPESLDELFRRIDAKLILGLPQEITESNIAKVVEYYRKERIRFVQDQANFVKPGVKRGESKSAQAIIERLKNNPLTF